MKKSDWLTAFLLLVIVVLSLALVETRLNIQNNVSQIEIQPDKEKIVFAGDSITDRYDLNKFYKYNNKLIINSGIGGYTTLNMLNRFNNLIEQHQADKMFLMIGTNDLSKKYELDSIVGNIETIIKMTMVKSPKTKIYVESIYPVNLNKRPNDKNRSNEKIIYLNGKIKELCVRNNLVYIDVYSKLVDNEGNLKTEYTEDGLHLTDKAYEVVTDILKPYVEE